MLAQVGIYNSPINHHSLHTAKNEAIQALVALGYGSTEALQAVKQVEISEDMEVEEVLKVALKFVAF